MIPPSKILVVTPAHSIKQPIISRALRLSAMNQTQITLFSVAEKLPKEQLVWVTVMPPKELMETLLKEQKSALEYAAAQSRADQVIVDTDNAIGTPFIEVIKKIKRDHYDLVILASKSTERQSRRLFGSTTVHLMRKSPCPVWVVGEEEQPEIKKILAAVDVYAPTIEGLLLNETILRWASHLAIKEGAELHVIHAWQLPGDDYLKGWGYTSKTDLEEMKLKEHQDRELHFDRLVKDNISSSIPSISQLVEGKPQQVIPGYVENNNVDLIVMGTVCRTGVAGFFIGNTAESIINEVSCSVLALKPEGFESPVA